MALFEIISRAEKRFAENLNGYFYKFRFLLAGTLLAATMDTISTIRFMTQEGAEQEVHPVIRLVCLWFGPIAGPIFGKVCQLVATLALTVYWRRQAIYIFVPVIILYTWAAWYNVWGRDLYVPRLLHFLPL